MWFAAAYSRLIYHFIISIRVRRKSYRIDIYDKLRHAIHEREEAHAASEGRLCARPLRESIIARRTPTFLERRPATHFYHYDFASPRIPRHRRKYHHCA